MQFFLKKQLYTKKYVPENQMTPQEQTKRIRFSLKKLWQKNPVATNDLSRRTGIAIKTINAHIAKEVSDWNFPQIAKLSLFYPWEQIVECIEEEDFYSSFKAKYEISQLTNQLDSLGIKELPPFEHLAELKKKQTQQAKEVGEGTSKKPNWAIRIVWLVALITLIIISARLLPDFISLLPWRSDLTQEEILWEEDLLNWTQFEALPYQRDAAEGEELPADKLLQPTITEDGILLNLAPGSNLELKRAIKIPQNKAGSLILLMSIKAGQATEETEQSVIYLIAKGKEPAVLDRFTMQADINRRYNVTSFAGATAQLLLKTQSGPTQPLSFLLEELKLKMAPKGRTITVKAIQSWNKQILDENAADYWGFYIKLEKLEENQYSFYQRIKTSMDGTTKIENVTPGRYRISLLYSTIAGSEIKDVLISESQSFKGQLSIPLSRMVRTQVFFSDAATPLKNTRIEVYTNGSNSGTALKWMDNETRKATGTEDKNEDTVWLFPSCRPEDDYYIFRAELDGQYIGEANCKLGVLDDGEALVRIVTNVSP